MIETYCNLTHYPMKRTLLTLMALMMAGLTLIAQQVPRDKVVIEIGTATW